MTNTCIVCATENMPGALLCANCSTPLITLPTATHRIDQPESVLVPRPAAIRLPHTARLRFVVQNAEDRPVEMPLQDTDCYIGRGMPESQLLSLNLVSYCSQNEGVSRLHAALVYEDGFLYIRDLNSTNGTFVNGLKVVGDVPLRDGDELRFGLLILHIYFK